VKEKLSGSKRFMIPVSGKRIRAYVHIVKKDFPTSNRGIAVLNISQPKSQGLHLSTQQDHSGLILVEGEVVVPGLTVLAYNLDAVHLRLPH
jgi:hypothetical protein